MAEEGNIEVCVSGPIRGSNDGWQRARQVPVSKLPELTPGQKDLARRFGASEEQWARRELASQYDLEWMRKRGLEFGRIVQKVLDSIASGYRLSAVAVEGFKNRWVVRILTPDGTANIAVPAVLAESILDSYTIQDLDQLKSLLSTNLQRKDLIGLQ